MTVRSFAAVCLLALGVLVVVIAAVGMFRFRQASATAFTRSAPPILPGLMRTASAPAAAASSASL